MEESKFLETLNLKNQIDFLENCLEKYNFIWEEQSICYLIR